MYKFLGTDDTVNTCDCCGRTNLKATVAIENEHGGIMHYGTTCAARALKLPAREVKAGTKTADDERRAAERAAKAERARAESARWFAFLNTAAGTGEVGAQIEKLGGFAAARAAYRAA